MLELFPAAPDKTRGGPNLYGVSGGGGLAGLGRRPAIDPDRAGKNQCLRFLPALGKAAFHKKQVKSFTPDGHAWEQC